MFRLVLFISLLCIKIKTSNASDKVSVNKCCVDGEFYSMGFDSCNTFDEEKSDARLPPVYSALTGELVQNITDHLNLRLTISLEDCKTSQKSFSTTKFNFVNDGTLRLDNGRRYHPSEFCINQILADSTTFAARFCIPDSCKDNTQIGCVNKCCPNGMALNNTDRLCHPSEFVFDVKFHNESDIFVHVNDTSYNINDGFVPKCNSPGFNLLNENQGDDFYVQTNGEIYIPGYPEDDRSTSKYCLDNFIDEENSPVALICFPDVKTENDFELALKIYPYAMLMASLFLISTFVVYAMLHEIRNIHGVNVMCLMVSMTVMYIGLGIIQLLSKDMENWFCVTIASIVHFAFLSTFTWLNVMSFDIFWTFRYMMQPRNTRRVQKLGRRFVFYSIYAWCVPLIIVIVGQILDNVNDPSPYIIKPGFGQMKCWFTNDGQPKPIIVYLYGPLTVLILSNIVFFVMTTVLLYRASSDSALATNRQHDKQKFRLIFSLFILMGVPWMMEIISFWVGGVAYKWIVPDIINICTPVFIFILFVCKPTIWNLLKIKFSCLKKLDPCCPSCMLQRTSYHQNQFLELNRLSNPIERNRTFSVTSAVTLFSQIRDSVASKKMSAYHTRSVIVDRNSKY